MKVASDLDIIYIIQGVKAANKWLKMSFFPKFAQKTFFKRVPHALKCFNDHEL